MIAFEEIDSRLESLGKDRAWLAAETGYSVAYIRDVLAPNSTRRTERIQLILSDPIEKEEAQNKKTAVLPPGYSAIFLTDKELDLADQASRLIKSKSLAEFCHDVIQAEARRILFGLGEGPSPPKASEPEEKNVILFSLPFLGAVAAGEPVEAPRNETIPVPKKYEPGHFVVEINGRSGEPQFHDGERWIVDGRNCFTPKSGKACIVSDESGSYLKKWNRKRGVFESINPDFPDVIPGEEAKLQGYPVEKLG